MRSSFVLYSEYSEHLEGLSLEQRGTLLTAIMNYANDAELPEMDCAVKIAFSFIKKQLDRDAEKYDEKVEQRRNAGRASGEARRNKTERTRTKRTNVNSVQRKRTNDDFVEQTRTKRTDNDDVNVNDNNTPLNPPTGEKVTATAMIDERGFSEPLGSAVKDWVKYKQEKRQGYKETGLASLLTEITNKAEKNGEQAVIDVIRESMASGYVGITWAHLKPVARSGTTVAKPNSFNSFRNQHGYDFDALKRQLAEQNEQRQQEYMEG